MPRVLYDGLGNRINAFLPGEIDAIVQAFEARLRAKDEEIADLSKKAGEAAVTRLREKDEEIASLTERLSVAEAAKKRRGTRDTNT